MNWKCAICGTEHEGAPLCFGSEAPWRALVPEAEFSQRVDLTQDQCVVDGKAFFIRGHIELPIDGSADALAFSVWSSLSEASFLQMADRWDSEDRGSDPPYFGWLSSYIPVYPNTINLKLSVQTSAPGLVPQFTLEVSDHPLSVDQHHGISPERWGQLAHALLHE
jgi:hypothetical protein